MAKAKITKINQKIEKTVVGGYKKIENAVVSGYKKVEDKFVDNYLTKDGESIKDAKFRVEKERKEMAEKIEKTIANKRAL